jgi:hypothetical protein
MSPFVKFAAADIADWRGVRAGATVDDFAELAPDIARPVAGWIGDPPRRAGWLSCYSTSYSGGLRLWVDDSSPLLLEGTLPIAPDGTPLRLPDDLGEADAVLDTVLDVAPIPAGELVFADRGLAVRYNPANRLLLGLRGFAPTSITDYIQRLRPYLIGDRAHLGSRR